MKSIKLQVTKVAILAFGLCLVGSVGLAQNGNLIFVESQQSNKLEVERGSSLKEALQLIESEFDVVFLYGTQTVQGKRVGKDYRLSDNFREATSELLEEHGMRFKYLSPKTYGIYGPNEEVSQAEEAAFLVSGLVTEAGSGEVLPGVNVVIKGTSTGTATNNEGRYEIDAPSATDTLVFSFVGYETMTIPIDGRSTIDVELQSSQEMLEDLVVTGYSSQQREDVTTSIASADVEGMQKKAVTNTNQALQGTVAGVHVQAANGNPGSDMNITIRGYSSFGGDNNPLVIVDGVQTESGLTNVNPDDIESIQVLKDASAAAIYGSRAANGVILVETKSGVQGGAPTLSYSNYFGTQVPYEGISLTNAEEYVTVLQRMYGDDLSGGSGIPQAAKDYLDNPGQFQSYDWQELIYEPAMMQNHNLSVSGGSEFGTYRVSAGYLDQDGITKGTGYERVNLRAKGEFFVTDNITVGQSLSLNRSKTLPEAYAFSRSMYQQAVQMYPYFSPKTEDGSWRTSDFYWGGGDNPEALIRNPFHFQSIWEQWDKGSEVSMNMYGEVELFEGFSYKISGSYSQFNNQFKYMFGDKGENQGEYFNPNKEINISESVSNNWNIDNTLRFDRDFADHSIDITAGFIAQRFQERGIDGGKNNFLSENTETLSAPGGQNAFVGSFLSESSLLSFISQLNYGFDDRYLLTVNFRRDGSSRFSPDVRWGNFPGGSLGWRISNESFWQNSSLASTITELKLRGGYGEIGRQNVGNYPYTPTLNYEPVVFGDAIADGLITGTPINSAISWESLITTTVGMDYELWNGKISGYFEYFNNEADEMIIGLPLAPSVGGGELSVNSGKISNEGFEMELNYNGNAGDFNYSTGFNLATTDAKVEELGTDRIVFGSTAPEWDVAHTMEFREESGGLAEFWLIETDGIFKSEEEVNNHTNSDGTVIQPDAEPGDIRFVDANDDGTITSEGDRQLQGSGIPTMNVGFNFSANYKGFDASLNMTGAFGQVVYNSHQYLVERNYGFENLSTRLLDAFHPENNPDSNFPRLNPNDSDDNWNSRPTSDRYLEDADYVKIRNLEFGYTLPIDLAGKLQMRSARIFLRGQNLYTFTGYSGADPEIGSSPLLGGAFTQGLDRDTAPQARSYQIGINLEF
ncbi:SusC/RagA family TonB-linked outer membrane protein [Halalkalibaculum sp. DA384]|uniref:SusC/RagA family TonB-linked outer membrane protein n=1 Tax=Halalkalibaculum sp. DA384 TaxID=3373606 RepID=UPI003753E926